MHRIRSTALLLLALLITTHASAATDTRNTYAVISLIGDKLEIVHPMGGG